MPQLLPQMTDRHCESVGGVLSLAPPSEKEDFPRSRVGHRLKEAADEGRLQRADLDERLVPTQGPPSDARLGLRAGEVATHNTHGGHSPLLPNPATPRAPLAGRVVTSTKFARWIGTINSWAIRSPVAKFFA